MTSCDELLLQPPIRQRRHLERVAVLAASAQLADEIDTQAAQQELDTALSDAQSGDGEPAEAKYARAQLRAAGQA